VKTCSWARDKRLKADERMILCETFKKKDGSQREKGNKPMELVAGGGYYTKKEKLFESVVGFATFSEYLIVAEVSSLVLVSRFRRTRRAHLFFSLLTFAAERAEGNSQPPSLARWTSLR